MSTSLNKQKNLPKTITLFVVCICSRLSGPHQPRLQSKDFDYACGSCGTLLSTSHVVLCDVDNGVLQLPQTQSECFDYPGQYDQQELDVREAESTKQCKYFISTHTETIKQTIRGGESGVAPERYVAKFSVILKCGSSNLKSRELNLS